MQNRRRKLPAVIFLENLKMIQIEFDNIPPSVNSAYPSNRITGRRFISAQYKAWKEENGYKWLQQKKNAIKGLKGANLPLQGLLTVEYNFTFPDLRIRDVGNYEKCLSDFLVEVGIIVDDSQIKRMVLEKYYEKGKPYTVIQIKPYS